MGAGPLVTLAEVREMLVEALAFDDDTLRVVLTSLDLSTRDLTAPLLMRPPHDMTHHGERVLVRWRSYYSPQHGRWRDSIHIGARRDSPSWVLDGGYVVSHRHVRGWWPLPWRGEDV